MCNVDHLSVTEWTSGPRKNKQFSSKFIVLAPLAKPVRFLGPRAPRLVDFLVGVLCAPLFAPTWSRAQLCAPRHREKHWRVSGNHSNAFRVALDDFTRRI